MSRTVTISSVTGGTVTTTTRFPYPNAWVTLTVTPDSGYELTDLTVTNRYGQTVPVHPLEDGRYGFTMPDSDVTVNPVFTKTMSSPLPGAGFGSGGYADIIYPGPAMAFTDTGGHWAEASVNKWSQEYGVLQGYDDGSFQPDASITRGAFAGILDRFLQFQSAAPAPSAALPDYRKGDMLEHKAFGQGMVLSTQKVGGDTLLEIAFDGVGTKRLMLKFTAQLMKKL